MNADELAKVMEEANRPFANFKQYLREWLETPQERFGGETMVVGEATERIEALNGLRVRVCDGVDLGKWGGARTGTIYNVYINRQTWVAQIWVNMDGGGARCFRPQHLETLNEGQPLIPEA